MFYKRFLTTLTILLLSLSVTSADNFNVEFVGAVGGPTYAVDVSADGNIAYIGTGAFFCVLDVSKKNSSVLLGKIHTRGIIEDIAVIGDYAYVAAGKAGLQIVNVSNPNAPNLVGSYDASGEVVVVTVAGSYAYVSSYNSEGWSNPNLDPYKGLILNIDNPVNPVLIGSFESHSAGDITVVGDYAYVADGSSISILNIGNPANPILIGSYKTSDFVVEIAVVGDYAYVANKDDLKIINVAEPKNPTLTGSYEPSAASITVVDSYAYVTGDFGRLNILDVSNPNAPTLVRKTSYKAAGNGIVVGRFANVVVVGDYAYDPNASGGLRIFDVSDPRTPTLAGSYETYGDTRVVTVAGDYAYVGAERALHIIDISNPENPTQIGKWDARHEIASVDVTGDYAYIGDWDGRLQIIDVSTPENPIQVGNILDNIYGYDIVVVGNYAYLAGGHFVYIVDISNPENPTQIGSCDTPGYAMGIAVRGDYAYVAASNTFYNPSPGMVIVDVRNPEDPKQVGICDTPGKAEDIAVRGDYAYVADSSGGLQVIDISNPRAPNLVGGYYSSSNGWPDWANSVAVIGDYAYVIYDSFLRIVDFSDPNTPTLAGSYEMPATAWDVTVVGDLVYVADGRDGLSIVRFIAQKSKTWDLNDDGVIDVFDLVLVGKNFGETGDDIEGDLNDDKQVNIFDLVLVGKHFGEKAAPAKNNVDLFQQIYDILKIVPNPNDNLKLALKELEKLLVPKETVLMQNYPNPFNPETWIPFQLAESANVEIRIYNLAGQLVREIDLLNRSAGIYLSKDRAAYWDGRNSEGEKVSSGLYFYTLQAGSYSATKRMLMLK